MSNPRRDASALSMERLEQILDAYGADSQAWPDQERDAALALLAISNEAQQLRERAAVLDRALDDVPQCEPSEELRSRVLASAPQPARSWSDRLNRLAADLWPFGPRWQPATALAAAAALGIAVGAWVPYDDATGSAEANGADVADVADLVFAGYSTGDEP